MPGSPPRRCLILFARRKAVQGALALAGMAEPVAMPAQEIAPRQVQLGDAPPAGDPVHHAGTDEIGPRASEATGNADDADGLGHVLPIAAVDAHTIGEMQPVGLGAQADRRDLLAVACPLPAAHPAGAQTALAAQPVHVERAAGFHRVAPRPARPSRSEAAHHALPFFPKSFGKFAGALIPISASAAIASAFRPAYQAEEQTECSQTSPALPMPMGRRR